MDDFTGPVRDGGLLVAYAASRNIPLPPAERDLLATADATTLRADPGVRSAFLGALETVSRTVGVSAADIRAMVGRTERLRPLVANALTLLDFAAGNARPLSDDIRSALTEAASAVGAGTATVKQEQDFLKAYEELTSALAPITAETLEVSTTRLPTPREFLRGLSAGAPPKWTLGRFVNASIFLIVLIGTGISLAYYYVGASALAKFRDLQKAETSLKDKEAIARLDLADKKSAVVAATMRAAKTSASAADKQDVSTVETNYDRSASTLDAIVAERTAVAAELQSVPERLGRWAMQPCLSANPIFNLALCAGVDEPQRAAAEVRLSAAAAARAASSTAPPSMSELPRRSGAEVVDVEAARTVISRLNDVYLPLLLGFLGAHAYILRRMSKDISDRAFAKGSSFNHIVRIGLGALAGLASTWLLTPELVGGASFKALPVWALAFVAGYGIELVFAFMDRIIAAFTSPSK